MSTLEVSRAAVEVRRRDVDPLAQRQARLGRWRKLAIGVSFAHMMTTIALYSEAQWYAAIVAGAMTLLIDIAIFEMIEHRLEAHREAAQTSNWVTAFLGLAIVLSVALNAAYLWKFRPPAEQVPDWLSVLVVGALAVFVPGWIAIAAVMSAELEARRTKVVQAASAAERRAADAEQRAVLAERERHAAVQRALAAEQESARLSGLTDQARTVMDQLRTQAERERTAREAAEQQAAHWRTQLEARPLLPDTPPDATITIGGRAYSVRAVAEAVQLSPSTLSDRLVAVRAKG